MLLLGRYIQSIGQFDGSKVVAFELPSKYSSFGACSHFSRFMPSFLRDRTIQFVTELMGLRKISPSIGQLDGNKV